MSDAELTSLIEAAEAYEAVFVPALFGEWAPRVADFAQARAGERVLDVACGTGVLAREIASRVGPRGSVIGVDPGPGMLAVAERLGPAVDWQKGAAELLPLPDESFDVVVSQFGLMFFSDPVKALREMRRVARPGGRLAVAVWDRLENNRVYADEADLLERIAGRSAADAVRIPFGLGDPERLESLFEEAGATATEITALRGSGSFASIRTMVEAELRGWLPVAGVRLEERLIQEVLQEAEVALASHVREDGTVGFETSALIVTATR